MLKIDRQNYIENKLKENGSILISGLSDELSCHEETIRRDIKEMESTGRLKRIHGGAYLPDNNDQSVPTELRNSFFTREKQLIAAMALPYIKPGSTVMLDSSTTCLRLAEAVIKANIPLTLITNSLRICNLFDTGVKNQYVNLVCAGGQFRTRTSSFIGYNTTQFISRHYADIAFISNPGIDLAFGLSDTNINEANVRMTMLQQSKEHVFLMDHTKFSKVTNMVFSPLTVIHTVITDQPLLSEWEAVFSANSIKVVCCETP